MALVVSDQGTVHYRPLGKKQFSPKGLRVRKNQKQSFGIGMGSIVFFIHCCIHQTLLKKYYLSVIKVKHLNLVNLATGSKIAKLT